MHVWSSTKIFPHGKTKVNFNTSSFSEESSCNTHRVFMHKLVVPRARWQLDVQNCWALRHEQAFLAVSRKQNPVHVHTKIFSRPGCTATSMSLSLISSRVKFTSMMAGETKQKSKRQAVETAQYGLEINFKRKRENS